MRSALALALSLVLSGSFACCAAAQHTAVSPAAPDVTVSGAWARATLPGQDNAAVYLTLRSRVDDVLTAVSSPEAGMTMLHRDVVSGGMEGMDDMDSVKLPAGQPVVFSPHRMHIMLMNLTHKLKAGDVVHLRLTFAHGSQDQDVPVRPVGATGP